MSTQLKMERSAPSRSIVEGRKAATDLKQRAFGEVRAWKIAFFVSFTVMAGAVGVLCVVAMSPPFVPYVAAVDQQGVQLPVGPAAKARVDDPAVVASELNRWLANVRTVTSDPYAQEQMVRLAYAYVAAGAGQYLNAYFSNPANDPRLLAQRQVRQVDVRSVLPLQPDSPTWVLIWNERAIDRGSGAVEVTTWQAYVSVKRLAAPNKPDRKTEEHARANPFGLYITDLSWSKISNPADLQRGAL